MESVSERPWSLVLLDAAEVKQGQDWNMAIVFQGREATHDSGKRGLIVVIRAEFHLSIERWVKR